MVILWVCYGYPMVLTRNWLEIDSKLTRKRHNLTLLPSPTPSSRGETEESSKMSYKLLYRATIDLPVTTIILEATIILQTTINLPTNN